jgi:hypothetical protein
VGVVEEGDEIALVDERYAPRGQALVVIPGGAEGERIRRVLDEATRSPRRSAKSDLPLATSSPESVPASTARSVAVTSRSNTAVTRALAGFVAPSIRVARKTASPAAFSISSSDGARHTL